MTIEAPETYCEGCRQQPGLFRDAQGYSRYCSPVSRCRTPDGDALLCVECRLAVWRPVAARKSAEVRGARAIERKRERERRERAERLAFLKRQGQLAFRFGGGSGRNERRRPAGCSGEG